MDETFECILVDKWIYIGVLSLFCIICVFRYTSSSLEGRQGGSVIYWIIATLYIYVYVVLLCVHSIIMYSQYYYMFVVLLHKCVIMMRGGKCILLGKHIRDNVLKYQSEYLGTWMNVLASWYRERDTGGEQSVLVSTRAVLGLWFICEVFVNK